MYPKFSDLLYDLLGVHINLPIQTYGFFVALAFVISGWILYLELKRKEREKVIFAREKEAWKGNPPTKTELVITILISFLAGFKLTGIVLDYNYFASNPQDYIFSKDGYWAGGIILAALYSYFAYRKIRKSKREKPVKVSLMIHPSQLTGNIILIAAVFGVLGSKLFDVIEHIDQLIKDPVNTLFSFSGLAFYGGLITAAFAVCIYAEKNKIPWPVISDAVAPSLMIAYGIGRIGCQLSGDGCWGVINNSPKPGWLSYLPDWMWAFNYPHNVINEGVLIPGCSGNNCYVLGQPVFPTPFYETVIALVFFIILWGIRKKIRYHGILFSIYLILNGIERFFIENIRVNIRYDVAGIRFTQAEAIAIGLILLGIAGIYYFRWWNKNHIITQHNQ